MIVISRFQDNRLPFRPNHHLCLALSVARDQLMQDLSSLLLDSEHFFEPKTSIILNYFLKLDSKKDSDLCVLQNISQAVYLI